MIYEQIYTNISKYMIKNYVVFHGRLIRGEEKDLILKNNDSSPTIGGTTRSKC